MDGWMDGWGGVGLGWMGGADRWSDWAECEGGVDIIKVSFPANMHAAHEHTLKALLRKELHCDRWNGLFLFAKILLLSGASALERFVQMHRDVPPRLPPLSSLRFSSSLFASRHFQNFDPLGSFVFFLPVAVADNWLCVSTQGCLKRYHCSLQIPSMYYTEEL